MLVGLSFVTLCIMRFSLAMSAMCCAALSAACEKQLINPFPSNYVGVGVELTMREESPVVVRAIAGGPAATAGLQPEDQLIEIDHMSTNGLNLADVVVKLRGAEGSSVHVMLKRQGQALSTQIVRTAMQKDGDDYTASSKRASAN